MRWLGVVLCWLALSGQAWAQSNVIGGGFWGDAKAAITYTGPIDAVGTAATAAYSCSRAPRAAVVSSNACILRRASDSTSQTINYLANGNFDVASANTFAGTDATCQGSTTGSSTTIAFTSCSSTPHVGSTLTGTGITQPSYIASCGAFGAGAGSCTLNIAQNIAVAETVAMQYGLYASTLYDGSGGTNNATQSTAGSQPQWFPNCGSTVNSKPCLYFNGSQSMTATVAMAASTTWTGVVERTNVAASQQGYTGNFSGGGAAAIGFTNAANTALLYNGSANVTATANDNVLHSFQDVANNSTGEIYVDGTGTTGSPGAGVTGTSIGIASIGGTTQQLFGYIGEVINWSNLAFSAAQAGNECHNQRLYYITGGSC